MKRGIILFILLISCGVVSGSDLFDLLKITPSPQVGPNCFNLALVSQNLIQTKRYVGPEEFLWRLKRGQCTETQKPVEGDIGIHSYNTNPKHAFVYINEKKSIERASLHERTPVQMAMPNDFIEEKIYVDCSDATKPCPWKTTYWHCPKDVMIKIQYPEELLLEKLTSEEKPHFQEMNDLFEKLAKIENKDETLQSLYDGIEMLAYGL